jgi:hypothetical protein
MTQQPSMNARPPRTSSAVAALWCCAALLGLNLILGGGMGRGPAEASAQNGQPGVNVVDPPFNAAEQRKRMIEQLVQLNDRIGRIEARLDKGISVRVTEMPAGKPTEAPVAKAVKD